MTPAQLATLKTIIENETDTEFVAYRDAGNNNAMADWFNQEPATDFFVFRTDLHIQDVIDSHNKFWVEFGSRNNGERDIVKQMFSIARQLNGGTVDPSKRNTRQGFKDAFSGTGQSENVRNSIINLYNRKASKVEKEFADLTTGDGSTSSQEATMAFEGPLRSADVRDAVALP